MATASSRPNASGDYGALLDAVRGVRWPARRSVRAGLPGAHRSSQRGTSGEFTEYRAYRQGDDPRRLDWKLLARSDRAFVRLTDERAWLPTWLVVDASASLNFPAQSDAWAERTSNAGPDKWTATRQLAVALAAVAHATGDPVGLLVATTPDGRRLPPRTRRGTVQAIAATLDQVTPGLAPPLAPLLARIPIGSRIVLLTDCLGDLDALSVAASRAVAAGTEVTVVHVLHPFEITLPDGRFRAIDPEHEDTERALSRASASTYAQNFGAWRARTAEAWRAIGVRHVEVITNAPLPHEIRRIVAADPAGMAAVGHRS